MSVKKKTPGTVGASAPTRGKAKCLDCGTELDSQTAITCVRCFSKALGSEHPKSPAPKKKRQPPARCPACGAACLCCAQGGPLYAEGAVTTAVP
jgi:hypothetical protein